MPLKPLFDSLRRTPWLGETLNLLLLLALAALLAHWTWRFAAPVPSLPAADARADLKLGEALDSLRSARLFGSRKGAFTGAERYKPGLLGIADGGTRFLDEINNAPMALHAKFLRVLQDGSFYPTGATEPIHVDMDVPPLRETHGDRALAAEILGIDKSTLWRKVKRYGIEE